jgi:hypothetical protein
VPPSSHRPRSLFLLAIASSAFALTLTLAAACTDQTTEGFPPADGSVTSRADGGHATEDDAAPEAKADAGGTFDAGCTYVPAPPVADGGGLCGAVDFGKPAAAFGGVDAGDTGYNRGGVIPPGIYDAIAAERGAGSGGSIRETLVVLPNNRFTRTRVLDTGSGPGPLSRRAGSYAYADAGVVRFTYDCATNDGASIDAGADSFPYEYVDGACGKGVYRFGLTSLRFTLERR